MDFKAIYNCPKDVFVLPFYPSSLQPFLLYPLAAGGKSDGKFNAFGDLIFTSLEDLYRRSK